ncbi:MAG: preprotein translocase subunit YajC [Chloroflexota bacterium]
MKSFKVLGLLSGLFGVLLLGGCGLPATGTTGGGTDTVTLIVVLVLIFAMFYFLTIRPQRRRQKEQQQLIESLKKGDRVITVGGIYGVVDSTDEESVVLKVESGTIRVARGGIHHKVNVG